MAATAPGAEEDDRDVDSAATTASAAATTATTTATTTAAAQPLEEYRPLLGGAEPYAVGLSPSYWCHLPLTASQIQNDVYHVVQAPSSGSAADAFFRLSGGGGGINCLLLRKGANADSVATTTTTTGVMTTGDNKPETQLATASAAEVKLVPVSKCRLVGTVVAVERRANGSVFYVVDDGTGLVDCLAWDNANDGLSDDPFALPPLIPRTMPTTSSGTKNDRDGDDGDGRHRSSSIVPVGEMVRIFGRIESVCLTFGENAGGDDSDSDRAAASVTALRVTAGGREWDCRRCIREVHAFTVERLSWSSESVPLHKESRHWERLCTTAAAATNTFTAVEDAGGSIGGSCRFWNANDLLLRLGPDIGAQVVARANLPSSTSTAGGGRNLDDDPYGTWRLFGTSCRCELSYKNALLCA